MHAGGLAKHPSRQVLTRQNDPTAFIIGLFIHSTNISWVSAMFLHLTLLKSLKELTFRG